MKQTTLVIMVMLFIITISGCFPGDGYYSVDERAGFFSGVWHGWIAPVSLIMGIFNNDVRIYEVNNTGWWYDCGFYIAIIAGFGGIAFTRKKKKQASKA